MKRPKITENWTPEIRRTGLKAETVDESGETYFRTMNWYVADDEEAAANAKFYRAAQKMAEALEALLKWEKLMGGWDAPCWGWAKDALLEAGYAEEDES